MYNFVDLDDSIRGLMCEEVDIDYSTGNLNYINSFMWITQEVYARILIAEFTSGDEEDLANRIQRESIFRTHYTDKLKKDGDPVKVRKDMHISQAEDEFNRYYVRAVCRKSIDCENKYVEIYRAKDSGNPRLESEIRIGIKLLADELLDDLRLNVGNETRLKLPEYRSGLSVKLIK